MKRPTALETLGGRLKAAREHAGLTQVQLAEAAGVNQSDITKLENGKRQGTAALARIAAAVKADPLWLESRQGADPQWAGGSTSELVAQKYTGDAPTRVAVIHVNLSYPEAAVLLRMVRAAKLPGVNVEVRAWNAIPGELGQSGRRLGSLGTAGNAKPAARKKKADEA